MRILWHSCAPWLGTGYGTQTGLWCRYLTSHGHDVAISSYYNSKDQEAAKVQDQMRTWEGITVYPPPVSNPRIGAVHDLVGEYAAKHQADAIIVLADIWIMDFSLLPDVPIYTWLPVDCDPLSQNDYHTLTIKNQPGRITPVAMSEHGQHVLEAAGLKAPYAPHAIDTEVWKPDRHRRELRLAYGITDSTFAIGMNYNNIDPIRKATPENFLAFKEFHDRVPDSVLFAHTMAAMAHSLDQRVLARTLGITDAVRFADQERVHNVSDKQFTTAEMVRWYTAMDVVVNATYGEGFGLPALEAQACGTPVILSNGTTGPQLKGAGWLVQTEPFWNVNHAAWWHRPSVHSIKKALRDAYQNKSPFTRHACRIFAEKYDIRQVGPMWLKILEKS